MKIRVTLYGTLRKIYPSYHASEGIEIEIPDGATIKQLFDFLGIPGSQNGVLAIVEDHLMKSDDILSHNTSVKLFQAMYGG